MSTGRIIEGKGYVLRSVLYCAGRESREFDVYLENGRWPSDKDLITLVDGGAAGHSGLHNGGTVVQGEQGLNHKIVSVIRK